jgi:hypothetical protein
VVNAEEPAVQNPRRLPAPGRTASQEMLCFHMLGWAGTEEVEAHLAKLKQADERAAKNR